MIVTLAERPKFRSHHASLKQKCTVKNEVIKIRNLLEIKDGTNPVDTACAVLYEEVEDENMEVSKLSMRMKTLKRL